MKAFANSNNVRLFKFNICLSDFITLELRLLNIQLFMNKTNEEIRLLPPFLTYIIINRRLPHLYGIGRSTDFHSLHCFKYDVGLYALNDFIDLRIYKDVT